MIDSTSLDQWITAHGLPMTITLIVIFLLFKYFLKQLNKESNPCHEILKKQLTEIANKLDTIINEQNKNSLAISNLDKFLLGVFFRNKGGIDD